MNTTTEKRLIGPAGHPAPHADAHTEPPAGAWHCRTCGGMFTDTMTAQVHDCPLPLVRFEREAHHG